jgi:hypothetical protein
MILGLGVIGSVIKIIKMEICIKDVIIGGVNYLSSQTVCGN